MSPRGLFKPTQFSYEGMEPALIKHPLKSLRQCRLFSNRMFRYTPEIIVFRVFEFVGWAAECEELVFVNLD